MGSAARPNTEPQKLSPSSLKRMPCTEQYLPPSRKLSKNYLNVITNDALRTAPVVVQPPRMHESAARKQSIAIRGRIHILHRVTRQRRKGMAITWYGGRWTVDGRTIDTTNASTKRRKFRLLFTKSSPLARGSRASADSCIVLPPSKHAHHLFLLVNAMA